MANPQDELAALRAELAALSKRLQRLEQWTGLKADIKLNADETSALRLEASKVEQTRIEQSKPEQTRIEPAGDKVTVFPSAKVAAPAPAPPFNLQTAAGAASSQANAAAVASVEKPFIPASHPLAFVTQKASEVGEDSSNLEGTIGGLWLNRIGIIATLFGVAYFLKLALDKSWISSGVQVGLGLLIGAAVIVWSERFRRKGFAPFSYSLKAVGLGAMYLLLWASSQYYHLVPVAAAFAAMALLTASTIALALLQDAEVLATFAMVGGFLTPALLTTGESHEVVLFCYVAMLNVAMLTMTAFKTWRRLLWLNFIGTGFLYGAWFNSFYAPSQLGVTVMFAALFAALFAAVPLVTPMKASNWHGGASFTLTVLPVMNTACFLFVLFLIYKPSSASLTPFALALAVVYLGLSFHAKHRMLANGGANASASGAVDAGTAKLIGFVHLALAIGCLTIAVPLQLNGPWITMGWLVESGLLVAIAVYTRADYLRFFAGGALLLGIFRLLVVDEFHPQALVFNERFATYIVAIIVLSGIVAAGTRFASGKEAVMVKMAGIFLNLLALRGLTLEAAGYFDRQIAGWYVHSVVPIDPAWLRSLDIGRVFSYSAIWLTYGAGLMTFGFWQTSVFVRWQALALMAFTIGKVFVVDVSALDSQYKVLSFVALGLVLMGISYAYHRDWLKLAHKPSG
jgi:uncharacterized membrane protein